VIGSGVGAAAVAGSGSAVATSGSRMHAGSSAGRLADLAQHGLRGGQALLGRGVEEEGASASSRGRPRP